MDIKKESGNRIKMALNDSGLEINDVSSFIPEFPYTTIHSWITGKAMIPAHKAVKLAKLLNVTAAYLLCVDDTPVNKEEQKLLDLFRSNDARGQETILKVAEQEATYTIHPNDDGATAVDLSKQAYQALNK